LQAGTLRLYTSKVKRQFQSSELRRDSQPCGEALAAEVGEEPEEERERGAEYKAGDDGEVERGVFAAMDDVARKAAKAEGQFATKVEKSTGEYKNAAEEKESATEFTERIHKRSLEEMK